MPPSPRICHLIHSGTVGGGPRVVLALARHVPGRHNICAPDDGPLLRDALAGGAETARLRFAGEFSFALSLPGLVRLFRNHDLVHLHGQFAAFYGAMAARLANRPAVYTAHFPSFITDWSWKNRIRNRVAEFVPCRLVRLTVACSETSRQEYVERGLCAAERVVTIYNGVIAQSPARDPADIRAELKLGACNPVVLAMGRFTLQKGFDVLLSGLPVLLTEVPGVRIILAGDGEERPRLEQQASALGVSHAIRFTGFRSDVADLLEVASVVAVPSRYEAFPLAPLEAMMAGRPVVASDLPALREAIEDGRTGRLIPLEPQAIATALAQLLLDETLRSEMGRRGAVHARDRFGVQRMADRYAAVYGEVLGGGT